MIFKIASLIKCSFGRYNIPNLSFGSNKYMPGASSALSMKASDTKGRYIIVSIINVHNFVL